MAAEEKKIPHISPETTGSEFRVVDEEFLQAKDLINVFLKTIKAFRLYPTDNPALVGMQEQLSRRFQTYLEMYNSFALQIGEYDFSFRGKIVYEDRELQGSLPFLFFKDGMRELRFMEGIEEWEIKGLTDIIIQRDNINEFEDDLITLIWEKDFIHISYIATDQFLEETPVLIPETLGEFRKGVKSEPMPTSARGDFEEEAAGGEFDFDWETFGKGKEPASGAAGVYFLTPEELESLRKEVKGELNPNFIFQVVDIIFEILVFEKETEPYQDAIRILQKLLDALLIDGEFQKARDLLSRVHIILNTYQLQDWQVQTIQHFVENLGDQEHTQRIGIPKKLLSHLGMAGIFHDIGKIKIPIEILNKPEKLTPEDWAVIRRHPVFGAETIMRIKEWGELSARMIYGAFDHHLKFDLSGYPKLSPL